MERSTSKLWDISWCSDKGIVEPSVTCLSSNSQSELKYVDVDIGVKAIKKKSRSKLIPFYWFELSVVYRWYPVYDQNYFLTIFDDHDNIAMLLKVGV